MACKIQTFTKTNFRKNIRVTLGPYLGIEYPPDLGTLDTLRVSQGPNFFSKFSLHHKNQFIYTYIKQEHFLTSSQAAGLRSRESARKPEILKARQAFQVGLQAPRTLDFLLHKGDQIHCTDAPLTLLTTTCYYSCLFSLLVQYFYFNHNKLHYQMKEFCHLIGS